MSNDKPKKIEMTFLEAVNHMVAGHPQLLQPMQTMLSGRLGRNPFDVNFLYELNRGLLARSKAQLRQDIFVLSELGFKREGFFVEFGAASGVDLSNSYLLEKDYGWRGILAEPARHWHAGLHKNRHCHIETDCVWRTSGERLVFNEVETAELSTIETFNNSDGHSESRKKGKTYEVSTISLLDLLEKYQAPQHIDYLSIDTEGSEYDILSSFDFDRYDIKIITCEHNYTPQRAHIHALLTAAGYQRRLEQISQFDDWYVRA